MLLVFSNQSVMLVEMGEMILAKFEWDCGRAGFIDGVFFTTRDELESLIGKRVYFGEVLGKHSEVFGVIGPGDVHVITIDPAIVDGLYKANSNNSTLSGYNPLRYVEEEE